MGKKSPNPTDVAVGTRIRIARAEAGLSQQDIGDAVGVTFQMAAKYERGINRVSASRLEQIAKAVKKPISWFFGDEEKKPGSDAVARMLALPYGIELATAYAAIEQNKDRQTVVQVARGLAGQS